MSAEHLLPYKYDTDHIAQEIMGSSFAPDRVEQSIVWVYQKLEGLEYRHSMHAEYRALHAGRETASLAWERAELFAKIDDSEDFLYGTAAMVARRDAIFHELFPAGLNTEKARRYTLFRVLDRRIERVQSWISKSRATMQFFGEHDDVIETIASECEKIGRYKDCQKFLIAHIYPPDSGYADGTHP